LAAYKRLQSLQCHSDFNNSSQTLHNFSLCSEQIKTVTNSQKTQEHDEQVHHLQTLTTFPESQYTQILSNSHQFPSIQPQAKRIQQTFHQISPNSTSIEGSQ
jgi:hypothetical protein